MKTKTKTKTKTKDSTAGQSEIEGNAIWDLTIPGSVAYGICSYGFVGAPARLCLSNATFGEIANPCTQLYCDLDATISETWPITYPGNTVQASCYPGYFGNPTRTCSQNGSLAVWLPIQTPCQGLPPFFLPCP